MSARLTEADVVCSALGPGLFGSLTYYVGRRPGISCAIVIHSARGITWCETHRGARDCTHVRAVLEYRTKWGERRRYERGKKPK